MKVEYEVVLARVEWRPEGKIVTGYTYPGTVRHEKVIKPRDPHVQIEAGITALEAFAVSNPDDAMPYKKWREWLKKGFDDDTPAPD